MLTMKSNEYHKSIRKPIAPPTKVFKSKRDYRRTQNYTEIDTYTEDEGIETGKGEDDAEEAWEGR